MSSEDRDETDEPIHAVEDQTRNEIKRNREDSKVEEREDFRQISYVRLACKKTITGKGTDGYLEAIDFLSKDK